MGDLIVLAISCILINNILLAQYLGNCPFLGTSKKMETAVGMAMAVVRFYVGQDEEKSIVRLNQKMQANFDLIPPGAG